MSRKFLFRIVTDLIAIACVGIPTAILVFCVEPYQRGFFCDDDTIRYPFKESTVTNAMLYTYAIGFNLVAIFIVEYYNVTEFRGTFSSLTVTQFLSSAYNKLTVFTFGALTSQLLTDIAKYSLGRLRPHFIDVCQPNVRCNTYDHTYHEDYICTSGKDKLVEEARLSFMSGHSSFSAYCMIFLALYLKARIKCKSIGLVMPLIQVILIYLSIYTGFSRISDYKHHWSDVLIGLINGTIIAIITVKYIANSFKERSKMLVNVESSGNGNQDTLPINYQTCTVEMQRN